MKVKSILVPIDFSAYSLRALDKAADLAAQFGASLTTVFVIEPITYAIADLTGMGTGVMGQVLEEQRTSAQKQLTALQRRYARRGIKIRTSLRTGVPDRAIIDTAVAEKATLIVMATHGRSGLAHAFIGSVAERVVRTAPCPVLTIGPGHRKAVKPTARQAASAGDGAGRTRQIAPGVRSGSAVRGRAEAAHRHHKEKSA
ncbi:MAG: universal stress protein [Candidatus Binatia bacterium]